MKLRIVFFGSPDFATPSLAAMAAQHDVALVVTQPDRPAGRGMKELAPAVKTLAIRLGLPVIQPSTMKDDAFVDQLASLSAELFVVVAYGRILPVRILALPRLGPFNVHASLLPKYRGAAPIQWSIIRGDSLTGVAIMRMEAGLDTGPVLAMQAHPIADDDTSGSLFPKLAAVGADLLTATIPRIADGSAVETPQDHGAATLAPMLKKEDGWLDFARPARLVSAQARGVDPWPGAHAMLDGQPMKLFAPTLVPGRGAAGEVIGSGPEGLVVACAEGAVAFRELQLAGRKRLGAAAVLAGRAIAPGTRLAGLPTST